VVYSRTPFLIRLRIPAALRHVRQRVSPPNWHAPKCSRTVPALWVVCCRSELQTEGIGKQSPGEENILDEIS
jgi:hypothetical protein